MIAEYLAALFISAGLVFSAIGVFGLYRMPDIYTRIHAGAKVIAIGSAFCLIALVFVTSVEIALRALAVVIFIYLTTPIATQATGRAAHRRGEAMAESTIADELKESREV